MFCTATGSKHFLVGRRYINLDAVIDLVVAGTPVFVETFGRGFTFEVGMMGGHGGEGSCGIRYSLGERGGIGEFQLRQVLVEISGRD